MKYQGIIFDLDGVLCFTDGYHYLAWKKLADRLGIYFDESINNRLRGVSRMESLNIILEQSSIAYSEQEKHLFAEEKNQTYCTFLNAMSPKDISKDTRETLQSLKDSGIQLAVGSSSKNTPLILEKTHLKKYFNAVADGNHITRSKPDPEVFLKAAEFLKLSPAQCLVIEDAYAGIDAATAGGFDSAGIGQAAGYEKCTYSIQSLSDLLRFRL